MTEYIIQSLLLKDNNDGIVNKIIASYKKDGELGDIEIDYNGDISNFWQKIFNALNQ